MSGKIFISYSSADSAVAKEIWTDLEGAGLKTWLDKREIRPGDSFLEKMNTGLGEASYLLLLCSRESASSHWVRREWMSALAGRGTVVIPILLDDSEVPPLLKDIVHIDLRPDRKAGIQQIVQFFQAEQEEINPFAVRSIEFSLKKASRRQLRLVATRCLDDAGLRSFCFDASLDPGSLGGASVHEKLVSLLHVTALEGLLPQFAQWLESEKKRCVQQQVRELQTESSWNWGVE
jgi:TIR domain